jgi:hypothetical protein
MSLTTTITPTTTYLPPPPSSSSPSHNHYNHHCHHSPSQDAPSNTCKLLTKHEPDEFISSLNVQGLPPGWQLPWKGDGAFAKRVIDIAEKKPRSGPCV